MEVTSPQIGPARRSCPACGETLIGNPRFCRSCGTEVASREADAIRTPGWDLRRPSIEPTAASAPAPSVGPRRPWGMIASLIGAGMVIVLLATWLVTTNGTVNDTKASLAAATSRISHLNGKVSSLTSEVDSLEDEKSDLETQNSSLTTAMTDCKDAASKTRKVIKLSIQNFLGTASVSDVRDALKESDRAWSVCQVEASSNGAI
jgi:hypothetical protein